MTRISASIVVPTFGGAERLPGLFEGMRKQRFDGDWELVVVLDGDVDDSTSVVESVDDLPVHLVRLPENRGRSAALNAGFAAARGEILIRCDDDLIIPETFLGGHVSAHLGEPPKGVVGLCHDVLPDNTYARVYGRPANDRLRASAYGLDPDRWWKFWAANCSVDRETYDRIGPYDEAFRAYGWEDVDWGYRLHRSGVPVELDRALEVEHLAASASVEIRARRSFLGGRAKARFEAKHQIRTDEVVPVGLPQHLWTAAVRRAAKANSLEACERSARRLDRTLDKVPAAVGARLIALVVESSSLAGYRSFRSDIDSER